MVSEQDLDELAKLVRKYVLDGATRQAVEERYQRISRLISRCGTCENCVKAAQARRRAHESIAKNVGNRSDVVLQLKRDLEPLFCFWETMT